MATAARAVRRRGAALRLLAHYFRFNLMAQMEYRVPFLVQVVMMVVNDAIFAVFWLLLFSHVAGDIRGYRFEDVMLLWSTMALGVGASGVLFGNSGAISRMIYRGALDVYLLQPKPVLLNLLASNSSVGGWGDVLYGVALFFITQTVTMASAALFALCAALACLVFTAVRVFYHSASFWLGNGEQFATLAADQMVNFGLYPGSIFSGAVRLLLHSLIPAALVAYLPAELFRGLQAGSLDVGLLGRIVAADVAVVAVAVAAFYLGLRRYESGNQIGARM